MTTRSQRVQFTLAWAVSLAVHALLVLLLYEAYSELRDARRGPLLLVSRDSKVRIVELPELAVRVDEAPAVMRPPAESRRRPDELVAAMPRNTAGRDELLKQQPHATLPSTDIVPATIRPRVPSNMTLPVAAVEMPSLPQESLAPAASLPQPRPASMALPRSSIVTSELWLPDGVPSLRIASLPVERSRARPLQLQAATSAVDEAPRNSRDRQTAPAFVHRVRKTEPANDRELAVARGLEFLARVQLDDGRWRFDVLRGAIHPDAEPVNIRADAAATGLALLAFLGAGHDHCDGPYSLAVDDALRYLVRVQQPSGELFPEDGVPTGQVARFYSHGIATLALCEAYGMTGDATLRLPAQRALDYLAATQNSDYGGWRYVPGLNTDLSVTGWQTAALRSGQLAGLEVPSETLARIGECLEMCRDSDGNPALFRYNPWASSNDPLTRHGRQPSTVMTAVGLATHFHLGGDARESRAQLAAAHLVTKLPEVGNNTAVAATGTLGNPRRDTYYWYYATQAMYYQGGERWEQWSARLDPLLIQSQEASGRVAGSWDPLRPTPDKWSAYGGRLYVTAMNLLSLEIRNRHLRFDAELSPQIADLPDDERR